MEMMQPIPTLAQIARAWLKHAHSFDRCEPLARSNSISPRFTDFPSLYACSESNLTNLIGSGLNLLCLHSHSKPECRWAWPGVPIFPARDKRDPWGRGCCGTFCHSSCLKHLGDKLRHFHFKVSNSFLSSLSSSSRVECVKWREIIVTKAFRVIQTNENRKAR